MVKMRLNSGHCNSLKRQLFSTHPWTKLWQQTVLKSGYSFWVWKVKPKQKGLNPVLFLKAGRQWFMQLQKYVQLWSTLWGNQPSAPLLFHLSKHFPDNFIVSVASVGSNWIKHEVCFVKCWSLLGRVCGWNFPSGSWVYAVSALLCSSTHLELIAANRVRVI